MFMKEEIIKILKKLLFVVAIIWFIIVVSLAVYSGVKFFVFDQWDYYDPPIMEQ